MTNDAHRAKQAAAMAAVALVEDGMKLGLGTGSTASVMVRLLAERVASQGLSLRCVSTSEATAKLAESLGVRIESLDDVGWLDMTIDGADEFDDALTLIKGGGGALLREKIVAQASDRMVVIADTDKHVARLGKFDLPVEVIPFGWRSTARNIGRILENQGLAGKALTLRGGEDAPFRTDEGNFILDLALGAITDAQALSGKLNALAGVVENGLFINMADCVLIGRADGTATTLQRA